MIETHSTLSDKAPWLPLTPPRSPASQRRYSTYVTMRDGARLAVDVHLPAGAEPGRVPAILHQTRYFRAVHMRGLFAHLGIDWLFNPAALSRDRFVAAGYAWVDVCVRGSGASTGSRPCPWSPDEIADGAEIVDWIVRQAWSDGKVGATGVSYAGTTAEFLLVNQHPAVLAIAPRFSLFDVYTDIAFPGGIRLSWFTHQWASFNQALDKNRIDDAFAMLIRLQLQALTEVDERAIGRRVFAPLARMVDRRGVDSVSRWLMRRLATGVRRVDGDEGSMLSRALQEHEQNFNVHEGAMAVTYRDDAGISETYKEANIDFFSPHAHAKRIAGAGAAIFNYSGWFDGAYQHSAVKRFLTIGDARARLILGPWEHGGLQNVSPFSPDRKTAFDQEAQLIRFFDLHLRGVGDFGDEPRVRYFTMGEEKWKSSDTWPPRDTRVQRLHLGEGRRLAPQAPTNIGADELVVDPSLGSGLRSRWKSLVGLLPPVGYADRRDIARHGLSYCSEPLPAALEVTGHPVVRLRLTCDQDDAQVFVYLEDEWPSGRVQYVTEGQLGARHRAQGNAPTQSPTPGRTFRQADASPLVPGQQTELVFDLLPVSWLFARGHRIRLTVTGADADHFEIQKSAPTLALHRGPDGSVLELPVMRG